MSCPLPPRTSYHAPSFPHPDPLPLSQLEEQSDQLQQLQRALEAKAGELAHAQAALTRTEQVGRSGWVQRGAAGAGVRG